MAMCYENNNTYIKKKKGSDGSGKLEKRWVEYTDKSYKALISAPVKKNQ